MKLFIDIETRSPVDLPRTGVYPYAENPNTELLCVAAIDSEGRESVWIPDFVEEILRGKGTLFDVDLPFDLLDTDDLNGMFSEADEVHAHNSQFERVVLRTVGPRYGIVPPADKAWRCSMALCGSCSLPLGLGKAVRALHLPEEKDDGGHRLMLQMSKPRKGLE